VPLPASYTESSLAAFMEVELGAVGTDLAIADGDALTEAVNEVAGLFGVSNVAAISYASVADVMKVRALARWQAWLAAESAAARQFDTRPSSGREFKLTDVWDQIQVKLRSAAMAAAIYPEGASALSDGFVTISSIADSSPYGAATVSEFG
jgi:hypothetical protein